MVEPCPSCQAEELTLLYFLQDWIRGKIPYFVAPPEPDTRDANGKLLPRPLKVAGLNETDKKKKTKGTGGTETLSGGTTVDAQGNTVKSIKGVTQPLHQIVHSNKFLADDNQKIDEDTDEEEDDDEEEAADEEWGGIAEDDIEADSDFEGDFEGEMPDGDVPLQWDELFAQAVGEESGDEDVEVVMDAPGETPLPKLSAKAEGKKKRSKFSFPSHPSLARADLLFSLSQPSTRPRRTTTRRMRRRPRPPRRSV